MKQLREQLVQLGLKLPQDVDLDALLAKISDRPARGAARTVGAAALIFFLAERRHNPKVRSIWDALLFASTSLSVGYGEVQPRTPVGKILASALMTYGPGLTDRAIDATARGQEQQVQVEIRDTLKEILRRLKSTETK
jgi:hypothetical protein